MIKGRFAGIAGLLAAGTVCAGLIAPAFSASPTKPVISQGASVAMIQMAQTLRSTHFSFRARTLRVYVGTDSRFLHIGHALKVVVRRPDRLRTTIDGDDGVPSCSTMARRSCCIARPRENTSASSAGYDRGDVQRGDEPHGLRLPPGGFP